MQQLLPALAGAYSVGTSAWEPSTISRAVRTNNCSVAGSRRIWCGASISGPLAQASPSRGAGVRPLFAVLVARSDCQTSAQQTWRESKLATRWPASLQGCCCWVEDSAFRAQSKTHRAAGCGFILLLLLWRSMPTSVWHLRTCACTGRLGRKPPLSRGSIFALLLSTRNSAIQKPVAAAHAPGYTTCTYAEVPILANGTRCPHKLTPGKCALC